MAAKEKICKKVRRAQARLKYLRLVKILKSYSQISCFKY